MMEVLRKGKKGEKGEESKHGAGEKGLSVGKGSFFIYLTSWDFQTSTRVRDMESNGSQDKEGNGTYSV